MMSKVQKAACAIHPATIAEPIGVSVYADVRPQRFERVGWRFPCCSWPQVGA